MALASLARQARHTGGQKYESVDAELLELRAKRFHRSSAKAKMVIYLSAQHSVQKLELKKFRRSLRSRHARANQRSSNRPVIASWVFHSVDGVVMLSATVVVSSFFIFLLELSTARPVYIAPSFSALILFSIIGAVALKMKRRIRYFKNGELKS